MPSVAELCRVDLDSLLVLSIFALGRQTRYPFSLSMLSILFQL